MRAAHLLCDEGITGSLWLAALVAAGAEPDALQQPLDRAGVPVRLQVRTVAVREVRATRVTFAAAGAEERYEGADRLRAVVEAAKLPARADARAHATVTALLRAEAAVHGVAVDAVRLHELGRPAAAAGILAGAMALELLDIDRVTTSPVALGGGTIGIAHGRFPVPPPAVLELLRGFDVRGGPHQGELTTPSGAAVLAALAEPVATIPAMRLEASGRGTDRAPAGRLLTVLVGSAPADRA